MCERAVAMAREVGARQVEGHALNTLGLDLAVIGRLRRTPRHRSKRRIAIAREVADADDIGRGYVNLCEAKRYCGDMRGAVETVREGLVAADEVGVNRTYGAFIRANGVAYAFELGEWDEASQWAEESIATVPAGRPQRRYGLSRWVPFLVATGRRARRPACSTSSARCVEGFPVETQFHNPFRIAVAEAALWRGEPAGGARDDRAGPPGDPADREWPRYQMRLVPRGDARRGGPGRGGPGAPRRRR